MRLEPGTRLGPYEVLAPLGSGGMGEVYRARDERLGREVAVKVLIADTSDDPERLRRFEQEARAVAALNHPGILSVFDVGAEDGAPYVVFELLEGTTLRDLARSGLSVRKALDYAVQIAQGLGAAHDKGIVHRDLKPENVFVTKEGRAKILDFGLARLTHPDGQRLLDTEAGTRSALSTPGTIAGTLGYMSPEQVRGEVADARSDLFAMGALLYEMLSGRRAFRGASTAEVLSAILRDDPPGLSSPEKPVPLAVERWVRRCLEKKPDDRFRTAHDLALALEGLSEAASSGTVPMSETAWRPAPGDAIPGREKWRLVRKLSQGGFGEVWLAEQEKTRDRRVFKFCFDEERLRSLKREVTIFRILRDELGEREDIARVYDWSFEHPPFFLELEYTEGGSLLEWAESEGGLSRVPLETRLELVAQTAEALAAAHAVGVLHKDVKPGNVLVVKGRDGQPKARLTDFGVGLIEDAGVLEKRNFTVAGFTELQSSSSGTSGTRLYMAPEVLEGKPPTTLGDVYGLGVMLYQLVVGDFQRAVAGGWEADVADDLLREDITACVEGKPEKRLGNALRLAERLRSLPERRTRREAARRATEEAEATRRALAEAKVRRRRALTAATVAGVFLVGACGVALWAERERRRAEVARVRATQARAQADGLLSFMLGDLKKKLEKLQKVAILAPVVEKALDYYKGIPADEASDQTELGHARALLEAGGTRDTQGQEAARSLEPAREALAILERLTAKHPEVAEWQGELAGAHGALAASSWISGDGEGAFRHASRGIEIADRLAAKEPDKLDWHSLRVGLRVEMGRAQFLRGDYAGQARSRLEAYDIMKAGLARHPDDPEAKAGLVNVWCWHSVALIATGDDEGAVREGTAMVALARNVVEHDPEAQLLLADALEGFGPIDTGLAGALLQSGDAASALRLYREAEPIRRTEAAADPDSPHGAAILAQNLSFQASALRRLGRLAEARRASDEAERLEPRAKMSSSRFGAALARASRLVRRGQVLAAQGEGEAARMAWRKALDVVEPFVKSDRPANPAYLLALLLLDEREKARPVLERMLAGGFRYKEAIDLAREKGLLPAGFRAKP